MSEDQDTQVSDKELNFRALEAKYKKELEAERQAREEAERRAAAVNYGGFVQDDDDDDPYVDKNKLNKSLSSFKNNLMKEFETTVESKVQQRLHEREKEHWLEKHNDFYDVMKNANKFAEKHPHIAKTILTMPDTFERQQLVYQNIKALGLDQPEQPEPSVQDKINANRRSPYYQPSGIANAPYTVQGNFSKEGQKSAYDKMQELKARIRL